MIEVTLPDGRVLDVVTDDPLVAAAAGKKFMANSAPPAQSPDLPPLAMMHERGQGTPTPEQYQQERADKISTQAVGRGVADLVGTGSDMLETMVNLSGAGGVGLSNYFTGREDQFPHIDIPGGSEDISDAVSGVGEAFGNEFIDEQDMTDDEALAYNSLRFGTGAGIGGFGLASQAPRFAANPRPAATMIGRLLQKYAGAYKARPVSTAVGDTTAGAGGGAALATYDRNAPENVKNSAADPFLRLGAMLVGGTGAGTVKSGVERGVREGVVGGTKRLFGLDKEKNLPGRGAFNEETGDFYRSSDVDRAASSYQTEASNLDRARDTLRTQLDEFAQEGVPYDALPAAGSMSDDVGLIAAQTRASDQNPVPFIEQGRRTAQHVRDTYEGMIPDGSSPRDLTNKVNYDYGRRVARAEGRVAASQQALAREERQAVNEARRTRLGDRSGDTERQADMDLYGALKEGTLEPQQARSKARYDAVDEAEAGDLDTKNLVGLAHRIARNTGALSSLPSKTRDLLRRVGRLKEEVLDEEGNVVDVEYKPITARDIKEVLPELSKIERTARNSLQPNLALAEDVSQLRGGLTRMIEKAAKEGDEAATALKTARDEYRKPGELGGTFGKGQARKFREEANAAPFDPTKQRPSQVASDFIQPNQPELAQELTGVLKQAELPVAERQRIVREKMLGNLAASGVIDSKTGQLRVDVLRKWRNKWGGTLPSLDKKLTRDIDTWLNRAEQGEYRRGELERDIAKAEARLSQVEKDKGALALVLDKSPDNAIESIYNAPDPERAMADIAKQIKNNEKARNGLKAALTRYLLRRDTYAATERTATGDKPLSAAKTTNRLEDEDARILSKVYSREEMNALRSANKVLKVEARGRLRAKQAGSDTAERMNLRALEVGLKAWYGVLKGGGVFRTIRLALSALPDRGAAAGRLIQQAQVDPELALHLLNRKVTPEGPAWNAKLLKLLSKAEAARAYNEEDEDDVSP